jgi:hypothetical protein
MREPRKFQLVALERFSYKEPSRFKRVMPPELPAATTDWDFSSADWDLYTSFYISPPSCLRFKGANILCKAENTTDILEGRLQGWFREGYSFSGYLFLYLYFLNYSSIGSVYTTYGYTLTLPYSPSSTYPWKLQKDTTTLYSGSSYLTGNFSLNTWHHLRLTWWLSNNVLIVRLEKESDGTWSKVIDDLTDSSPSYQTLKRVGCRVAGNTTNPYGFCDDLEIFKIVWS